MSVRLHCNHTLCSGLLPNDMDYAHTRDNEDQENSAAVRSPTGEGGGTFPIIFQAGQELITSKGPVAFKS